MSGKGSQRRPEAKKGSFREGHAAIDWSKGRRTSPRAKRDIVVSWDMASEHSKPVIISRDEMGLFTILTP